MTLRSDGIPSAKAADSQLSLLLLYSDDLSSLLVPVSIITTAASSGIETIESLQVKQSSSSAVRVAKEHRLFDPLSRAHTNELILDTLSY